MRRLRGEERTRVTGGRLPSTSYFSQTPQFFSLPKLLAKLLSGTDTQTAIYHVTAHLPLPLSDHPQETRLLGGMDSGCEIDSLEEESGTLEMQKRHIAL